MRKKKSIKFAKKGKQPVKKYKKSVKKVVKKKDIKKNSKEAPMKGVHKIYKTSKSSNKHSKGKGKGAYYSNRYYSNPWTGGDGRNLLKEDRRIDADEVFRHDYFLREWDNIFDEDYEEVDNVDYEFNFVTSAHPFMVSEEMRPLQNGEGFRI